MKKLLSVGLIAVSLIILSAPKLSYADGWRRGSGFGEGDLNIDKNSVDFAEKDSSPSTPGSNRIKLYSKDDGAGTTTLYTLDSTGAETNLLVGTSGAPIASSFITVSADATLTAERSLAEGLALDLTDGGANSTMTVAFDPTELTGARTWAAGGAGTVAWTFDTTGTDQVLTADGSGFFSTSGDFKILGDDLFMATNTSGAAFIADGTNFNPVVISGDVAIGTTGTATIQANSVALTTDTTGNYVESVATSALTGLTGGAAGSEGGVLTLAWDYTATVAGNPALASAAIVAGTTGLIF